jgi:RanBP-type and C3HC4-type zinc finger-containing protein 1
VIPPDYIPQPEERKYMDGGDDQLRLFLEQEKERQKQEAQQNYLNLLNTDVVPVVTNNEAFECPVCYGDIEPEEGIRLRNCLHLVCKECLKGSVVHSEEAVITCPYFDEDGVKCEETVEEREIRHVLDDKELENFHNRGLRQAENTDPKSFHCKTVDCPGFCFYEDEVNQFRCQICNHVNCILCKAQHEDMNCKEYQEDLKIKAANDEAARQTQQMLEDMVKKGEAMHCPNCKVVVTKKVGCDWIRCLMCKTEMCWATKGPRWGPKGRGDITGGCKCGINGKKCHPKCGNCH